MVFENRLFLFTEGEKTPLTDMLMSVFSSIYTVRIIKTLHSLDDMLMGSLHGAIILFDWDFISDPYKTLVNLRKNYYVWPIIVVAQHIGHQLSLNLLREQVNDILEGSLSKDTLENSLLRIISEFPGRSVLNTLFYVTRTYKGFSHMEDRIQKLEKHVQYPFGLLPDPHYEDLFSPHVMAFSPLPYRLLLVDDRPALLHSFKHIFREKYEILTANSADAALAITAQNLDIDLIILDIEMPGRKGNEIISELRTSLPNAAILIQTAYKATDTAIDSFQKGALDYINKSESPARIAEKIEDLLSMKQQWDAGRDLPLRIRQSFFLQFVRNSIAYKQCITWKDVQLYFPEKNYQDVDFSKHPTPEVLLRFLS